jgi:hypothetical protein
VSVGRQNISIFTKQFFSGGDYKKKVLVLRKSRANASINAYQIEPAGETQKKTSKQKG